MRRPEPAPDVLGPVLPAALVVAWLEVPVKFWKLFRRRPRSELEVENARLKHQLALAGLLVHYYANTRRPCDGRCTLLPPVKPRPRHRWRTNLHAPTEIFTKTYR